MERSLHSQKYFLKEKVPLATTRVPKRLWKGPELKFEGQNLTHENQRTPTLYPTLSSLEIIEWKEKILEGYSNLISSSSSEFINVDFRISLVGFLLLEIRSKCTQILIFAKMMGCNYDLLLPSSKNLKSFYQL